MHGLERRLAAGRDPKIESLASLFVSPWDVAVSKQLASPFHNRLGIAVAMRTFKAYCELLVSDRWQRLAAAGARPQRLLWASTGAQDPSVPDTLYVAALAGAGYAEAVLSEYGREGVDIAALAGQLQRDGVAASATSWHLLLSSIQRKCSAAASTARPRHARYL
jgi:transaldolase